MKKSPLFTDHVTNGASMDHFAGWTLPAHFSSPEDDLHQLATDAGIIDRCRTSMFTLSGDATRRWCHGMFTNDVKTLEPGQGHRAAMCDDRGRILGLLDLYCIDNEHFFVVHARCYISPLGVTFRLSFWSGNVSKLSAA